MSNQLRNAELVALLSADFRRLNNPTHAWGDVTSFVLALPGLVGYWPGVVNISTPTLTDVSGNGLALTRNGDANVGAYNLAPVLNFDGTGDYFSHADDARLRVLGTEAIITASLRGMTQMCWARFARAPGTASTLLSKWNSTGNQRSWAIGRSAGGNAFFQASADGVSVHANINLTSTATMPASTWSFVAARFVPSGVSSVFLNLERVNAGGNGPAALFNSTASFVVGGLASATSLHNGLIAFPVLCASALSNVQIEMFATMTAPLFGPAI